MPPSDTCWTAPLQRNPRMYCGTTILNRTLGPQAARYTMDTYRGRIVNGDCLPPNTSWDNEVTPEVKKLTDLLLQSPAFEQMPGWFRDMPWRARHLSLITAVVHQHGHLSPLISLTVLPEDAQSGISPLSDCCFCCPLSPTIRRETSCASIASHQRGIANITLRMTLSCSGPTCMILQTILTSLNTSTPEESCGSLPSIHCTA